MKPRFIQIRNDHARATAFGILQRAQADGAGADHQNGICGRNIRAAVVLRADAVWFDNAEEFFRNALVGEAVDMVGVDAYVFAKPAVSVDAHGLQMFAHIRFPNGAGVALPTRAYGINAHFIADANALHGRADGFDYAAKFVPQYVSGRSEGVAALNDLKVGSADARGGYADQNVVVFGKGRLWQFDDLDLSPLVKTDCLHVCRSHPFTMMDTRWVNGISNRRRR